MNLRHYELANERKLKFGENALDCLDDPGGDISVSLLAKPSGEPSSGGVGLIGTSEGWTGSG